MPNGIAYLDRDDLALHERQLVLHVEDDGTIRVHFCWRLPLLDLRIVLGIRECKDWQEFFARVAEYPQVAEGRWFIHRCGIRHGHVN